MIAVAEYGVGNVSAFLHIFRRLDLEARAVRTPREFDGCTKIILPGVGSFDWAMTLLNGSGIREELTRLVRGEGVPILGICVGMQMLCSSSEEGQLPGLGWVDAVARRFTFEDCSLQELPLPHMGWNDVRPAASGSLFRGMDKPRFYFLHSYYVETMHSVDALATTEYGGEFVSALKSGDIYGTQFHPEKSHHWGINLLKNFAAL